MAGADRQGSLGSSVQTLNVTQSIRHYFCRLLRWIDLGSRLICLGPTQKILTIMRHGVPAQWRLQQALGHVPIARPRTRSGLASTPLSTVVIIWERLHCLSSVLESPL